MTSSELRAKLLKHGRKPLGKLIQSKYDGKFENLTVYGSGTGIFAHAINTKIANE